MPTGSLNELMEQASHLPEPDKQKLAAWLSGKAEAMADNSLTADEAEADPNNLHDVEMTRRQQHLAWLKANREQYAGQYVALNGSQLVGAGEMIREAEAQAQQNGVIRPFLVYVFPADSLPFGGW